MSVPSASSARRVQTCRAPEPPPTSRVRAFTLIELLVTISIIGILLAILAPALGAARNSAKDTKCLSNARQLALAWDLYTEHNRRFPNWLPRDVPTLDPPFAGRWGGFDPEREREIEEGVYEQVQNRVLNEWVGAAERATAKQEFFRCPRDTGAIYPYNGEPVEGNWGATARHRDERETVFGIYGNSYRENEWVWARVGSNIGGGPPRQNARRWVHNNNKRILVNPSRTVLLGDFADVSAYRLGKDHRAFPFQPVGNWHGEGQTNVAFWDGSARRLKLTPGGYGDEHWFWIDPSVHDPARSTVNAAAPGMIVPIPRQLWFFPEE